MSWRHDAVDQPARRSAPCSITATVCSTCAAGLVWAGERASYIIAVDFATTAGRVVACAFHAMRAAGRGEQGAADAVIDVVLKATA